MGSRSTIAPTSRDAGRDGNSGGPGTSISAGVGSQSGCPQRASNGEVSIWCGLERDNSALVITGAIRPIAEIGSCRYSGTGSNNGGYRLRNECEVFERETRDVEPYGTKG